MARISVHVQTANLVLTGSASGLQPEDKGSIPLVRSMEKYKDMLAELEASVNDIRTELNTHPPTLALSAATASLSIAEKALQFARDYLPYNSRKF